MSLGDCGQTIFFNFHESRLGIVAPKNGILSPILMGFFYIDVSFLWTVSLQCRYVLDVISH